MPRGSPEIATLSNLRKNVTKCTEFENWLCKQALTRLENVYGIYHEFLLPKNSILIINKPMYTVYCKPGLQSCLTGLHAPMSSTKNQKHIYINKLAYRNHSPVFRFKIFNISVKIMNSRSINVRVG